MSEIRERIITIALSYVGQLEKQDNQGWNDPNFQSKMAGIKWWKGAAWCGFFQTLVWTEAYTTGNQIVGPSSQAIKSAWADAKSIPSPVPGNEEKNAINLYKNKKLGGWAPVTKDQKSLGNVKPGDLVVFASGHGEILIQTYKSQGKITSFDSVGGNSGEKVSYNKGLKLGGGGGYPAIKGFAQVIIPN